MELPDEQGAALVRAAGDPGSGETRSRSTAACELDEILGLASALFAEFRCALAIACASVARGELDDQHRDRLRALVRELDRLEHVGRGVLLAAKQERSRDA